MKTLFIVLLFCLIGTTAHTQQTQFDVWIPWDECPMDSMRPVNVGDRHIIMRIQPHWTTGERLVSYSMTTMTGTQWFPYGTIGPEEHLFDITYDDPMMTGMYFEFSDLALRFIDPISGDTTVSTPLIGVVTEPAPPLSITIIPTSSDSVKFTVDSETPNGGWGAPATCSSFARPIKITGTTPDGTVAYDSTLASTPGAPTHVTLGFAYNGDPTTICLEAAMKRMDQSSEPAFYPYVITYSNLACVDVGEISTSVSDASLASPIMIANPNPCRETVQISATNDWEIRDVDGRLVQHGYGPETINAETWSSGIYLVRSGEIFQKLLRE